MWKYLILITALLFSGCSYFKFGYAMCEQIAEDPHKMTQECKDYNEEKARKASQINKIESSATHKDDLEFKMGKDK